MERFETEIETPDGGRRVSVAWRGEESGYGVLYFFPSDPAAPNRLDRRALLPPAVAPQELEASRLLAMYEAGRPLTETERRFTASDGRQWLAQSQGPVWAGSAGAEGGTGVLLISLEGAPESISAPGGHVGEMADDALVSLWRVARAGEVGPVSGASESDGDV